MTTDHSTYTYGFGQQETVTLTRGPATPTGHALLNIKYSDGQIVGCYVNTEWLRDRAEDLGEPRRADTCPDKDVHWRYDEAQETIQRLTRERDEARARLAGVTIPVPDITVTDGMVERAFDAADQYAAVVINKTIMREALAAALTEPPARPEGAEEIHRLMLEFWGSPDDSATGVDLANHLAERGVRVVTEEDPR